MRNAVRALLTFVFVVLTAHFAAAQDVPSPSGYVTDDADVLDDGTERGLESRLTGLRSRTGVEVAVVTVRSLGGLSVEEYTTKLWAAWRVGDSTRNDGAVVLVAPNDRATRIEFGPGLADRLSNDVCAQIVEDEMLPRFRNGDVEGGTLAGVDALIRLLDRPATPPAAPVGRESRGSGSGMPCFVGVLALLVLLAFFIGRMRGGPPGGGGRPGYGTGFLHGGLMGRSFGGGGSAGRSSGGFGGGSGGGGGASGRW